MTETFFWRDGAVEPGPAVLVDLDGTLADVSARLLELLDPELVVVLLTARPTKTRKDTVQWLRRHGVRWDLLVMRAPRDFRPSPEAKLEAVRALRHVGFDLRLALDDDARNAAMFRSEGIPCVELSG